MAEKEVKQQPLHSEREHRWSMAQWPPRIEGKKTRIRLQYGTKDNTDPTGFKHQSINMWPNDIDDLLKVTAKWIENENKKK